MKKLGLFMMAAMASLVMEAQINTPAPSPGSTLNQKVGLTDVTVDYSRPSMRGRTIFGDLVPYDKLWRTGANYYTKISFSTDATIANQEVKAGTYSVFSKPGAETWEFFFYTDTQGGGVPSDWDDSKVVAKTTVPVIKMPMKVETFTITIDDVKTNGANLGFIWEDVYVAVPFSVPADAAVMKSIETTLAGPAARDYYIAAVYYLSEGKDISKAKEWMDKAMEMTEDPQFWQLRQQSLIYAKAGDKKGAIEIAKESLAKSEAAGNADYVKMNQDSLKEWGAK